MSTSRERYSPTTVITWLISPVSGRLRTWRFRFVISRAFHYFKEHDRKRLRGTNSVKHLTARLCEECRELDLIVQFANAGKHRFLTPAQNYMIPTSTSAVSDAGGRLKIIATGEFFDQVLTGAVVFLRGWIG